MFSASEFRELVSGRRRGITASLCRGLLRGAEPIYAAAVSCRNRRFDRGRAETSRMPVPVVSVGNITMGGTGKTPLVAWLARWFRSRGVRVTLVSRGYKARGGAGNDEALELQQQLPDVPHLQNPDRVAAAQTAIDELDCQLILLDDAFQHRRIHRDLDIVLIDALEPFGFDHVFPRGTLREPLTGLARADIVALSRANAVDETTRREIERRVRQLAPQAAWIEIVHRPTALIGAADNRSEIDPCAGRKIAAFCGIGNPAGFRQTLQDCGFEIAGFREFPDHHAYSRTDIDQLADWIGSLENPAAVICTRKDLVKIAIPRFGGVPLWALAIETEITAGENELLEKLDSLVAAAQSKP